MKPPGNVAVVVVGGGTGMTVPALPALPLSTGTIGEPASGVAGAPCGGAGMVSGVAADVSCGEAGTVWFASSTSVRPASGVSEAGVRGCTGVFKRLALRRIALNQEAILLLFLLIVFTTEFGS